MLLKITGRLHVANELQAWNGHGEFYYSAPGSRSPKTRSVSTKICIEEQWHCKKIWSKLNVAIYKIWLQFIHPKAGDCSLMWKQSQVLKNWKALTSISGKGSYNFFWWASNTVIPEIFWTPSLVAIRFCINI